MIKDDSGTAGEAPDGQRESANSHSRIWVAFGETDQPEILAFMLPLEIDFLVNEYLLLLRDLEEFDSDAMPDTAIEMQAAALARLQVFIETGLISIDKMNAMSLLILGSGLFPTDEQSPLYMWDLTFDQEV